jgi:hypothetical protein
MVRRLGSLLVVLGALALPAVASAAYPAPFAVQGGQGLSSLDGTVRYVAQPFGANTRIDALGAEAVARSVVLRGDYGIATLTQNGVTGGLFHDGSAFVAQSLGLGSTSSFGYPGAVVRSLDRQRATPAG